MRSTFTDYNPNPQKKVSFLIYIFVFDCVESAHVFCLFVGMLPFDVWPSSHYQRERFLSADFGKAIVLTTQPSQITLFRGFLIAVAC